MVDPVTVDPEGDLGANTYEREYITAWFSKGRLVDPLTNCRLRSAKLTENLAIKRAIQEFKDERPELIKALEEMDQKVREAQAACESARQDPTAIVPWKFLDKVTHAIMRQPVRARDGHLYEKRVLLEHIRDCKCQGKQLTSPITKEPMEEDFEDEISLGAEINKFLERHFGSAKSVTKLANHGSVLDLSNLFSALDGLKDILVETLGTWKPPYLVVFGAESVGKSTLLQRLSLLPFFPTYAKRCTRMPIRVEIRRSTTPGLACLAVWAVKTQKYVGEPELISLAISDGTGEKDVTSKMMSILEQHCSGNQVSLDFELHIKATSITLPPMNLVDLPGIVDSEPALKEQTEALLARYVTSPDSRDIFLAVAAVGTSPANWTSTRLVRHHNLVDRAIGVITKCDKLDPEEVDILRGWINGTDTDGILPLDHGYVAVAKARGVAKRTDESHAAWMHRLQEKELQEFADLNMADCVEASTVCIQALLVRINRIYSWHVIHTWLPSTASRLLQVWHECCDELRARGLPRSSGQLQDQALTDFRKAATEEVKGRLSFLVDLSESLFHTSSVKPMREYLNREFERLSQVELALVNVSQFLEGTSKTLSKGIPVRDVRQDWLDRAFDALEPRIEPDSFQLQRLPNLVKHLKENLETNQPKVDVGTVRKQITRFFEELFCPRSSVWMDVVVDEFGKARLKFNTDKIVGVCLVELANSFKAITTTGDFTKRIITPALVEQEQETCYQTRQRVFDRMSRTACALQKLIGMRGNHGDLDADGKLLAEWWPEQCLRNGPPVSPGDSELDASFQVAACNWLVAALNRTSQVFHNLIETEGGMIDGQIYCGQSLYIKALQFAPGNDCAWVRLGRTGVAKIGDKTYEPKQCYCTSLNINPQNGEAWYHLGCLDGGEVGGKFFDRNMCYQAALDACASKEHTWFSWFILGTYRGGGIVEGHHFDRRNCVVKALDLNPKFRDAWLQLVREGGGHVGGRWYDRNACDRMYRTLPP